MFEKGLALSMRRNHGQDLVVLRKSHRKCSNVHNNR